jgi:hypothetical protein
LGGRIETVHTWESQCPPRLDVRNSATGDIGAHVKLDKWFERPLPLQTDLSGLFFFGLDNGRVRAMLISPEVDRVLWEGEFQDPEDLARYIVDTMPWLAPHHLRYVGGESVRLAQALREGIPYEQG